VPTSASLSYALGYDFDTDPIKLYTTTPTYPQSTSAMTFTDALDLSAFKNRGGKMMMYQGGSDPSVSIKDTLRW
jgi:feruloyl esterase